MFIIISSGQESLALPTKGIHKMKQMEANCVNCLFSSLALLKIQKENKIHLSVKSIDFVQEVDSDIKKGEDFGFKEHTSSDTDIKALEVFYTC